MNEHGHNEFYELGPRRRPHKLCSISSEIELSLMVVLIS